MIPKKISIHRSWLNRRAFVAGATGLGVTSFMMRPVRAQDTPKRGGELVMAISQGNTTDSLDPARATAELYVLRGDADIRPANAR